jgi:4-amino-4-deoxy-L-arabinose transferase-like glycosyltransferase
VSTPTLTPRHSGARSPLAAARQRLGATLRAVPAAAWVCALVALLNAAAWSLLTPPFQIPDEPAQYAYAEHVAQTGRPPAEQPFSLRVGFSPEEALVLRDLRSNDVAGHPKNAGPWLAIEQRRLERDLHAGASRHGDGYSYGATPQPPLSYALAAIPYRLANGATLLQRLELMRLLCALLGGLTVLFVFLFLREALPRTPWSWTVGALAAALLPMFAQITSGVNPDALLFTASAALFWCIARAFRHGLDRRLAVATGAVIAVGLLAKLNIIGLLPGAMLALLVAAARRERALGRRRPAVAALRLPALTLAIAAVPLLIELLLNTAVWDRPAIGLVGGQGNLLFGNGSLTHHLAYLWETYLPAVPGMERVFHHDMTLVHFDELVGAFGGRDTRFPTWVDRVALVPAALVIALALRALRRSADTIRSRRAELLCYGVMGAGLLLMVTAQYYALETLFHSIGEYHQVRYFFPLLPLYGALIALAARGAGRRMAVLGATVVVIALAHDVWSQLLVVGRFYA